MIRVSELYIYPVKSLAGIKLNTAKLSPFGLQYDRRWMIVDTNGKFISQRELAKMATIRTKFLDGQLMLSHLNSDIKVPRVGDCSKEMLITVWKDTFQATHVSKLVDSWLSDVLQQDCQLVYMQDGVQRQIDLDFAPDGQNVSFADAYPLLVISQASLDDLNSRLKSSVNINRFRANIIVSGTQAFAEDDWQNLSINGIEFKAVKKCSRCIMPSINQQTGIKDQTKMLSVLSNYRKEDKKIKFGQNLIYKDVDLINGQSLTLEDEVILK